jgi:hypothetical protein
LRPSKFRLLRNFRSLSGQALTGLAKIDHLTSNSHNNFQREALSDILDIKSNYLLFYLHFDKNDSVDQYDSYVINTLKDTFESFYLVSNSKIDSNFIEEKTLLGKNRGRDLGAMRDIVSYLIDKRYPGKIVFLNNSMYWGPQPQLVLFIKNLFEQLAPGTLVGAVESFQIERHFQSFALGLQFPDAAESCPSPLGHVRNWKLKRSLVRFGEIPICRLSETLGYRTHALVPRLKVTSELDPQTDPNVSEFMNLQSKGIELNPTQHHWRLLRDLGIPGIKRSLVHANPAKLKGLEELPKILKGFQKPS